MGRFPGFWRVIARHGRSGLAEFTNSVSKRGYLALCRQYCPDLTLDELQSHPAGVRAQAILKDGALVHDFLIRHTKRTLHVCNAPSPAATPTIPIGSHLAEQAERHFEVKGHGVPTQ